MKQLPLPQLSTVAAAIALGTLAAGVFLVAGLGWALIVASALVLVYLVLPDQREEKP